MDTGAALPARDPGGPDHGVWVDCSTGSLACQIPSGGTVPRAVSQVGAEAHTGPEPHPPAAGGDSSAEPPAVLGHSWFRGEKEVIAEGWVKGQ